MRSQDELIQYLQDRLHDDQSTIDVLSDTAYELFLQLGSNRPPLDSTNPLIGIGDTSGVARPLTEYYKDKRRIEFLMFWTTQVLPILHLLTGIGKLPFSRNVKDEKDADYETFVSTKLKSYMDALAAMNASAFLSADDVKAAGENCDDLLASIGSYLEGLPEEAYKNLKRCMERIEGLNLDHLTNGWTNPSPYLFKMRLGSSNRTYSTNDMFHIPFEDRGLVKTNRYSIPGLPCVYLGSTPLTCWEEMGKPDLSTTHTSLYLPSDTLSFFDISIPPTAIAEHFVLQLKQSYGEDLSQLYQMVRTYLIAWPLIACCSIRVMNSNDTFKPEYIVSQLLLQWIQQSGKYDGVGYFSTKIDNYTRKNFKLYQNYAFPVKERKSRGHCDKLRAKFVHITNAAPWQVFQLHKGGGGETSMSERSSEVELMSGIPVRYNTSDFGRLETFLLHVMEAEMKS